jgi:hypothetical protein
MDHAVAHERLADLYLEPKLLASLDDDSTSDGFDFRAHLDGCPECRAELVEWRGVWLALDTATGRATGVRGALAVRGIGLDGLDDAGAALPVTPPPALRARLLASVAGPSNAAATRAGAASADSAKTAPVAMRARGPARRLDLGAPRWAWLATAAALVVALGTGALAWQRSAQLDQARGDAAGLAGVTATLGGILADPSHRVVTLRTADGTPGGTLAWSTSDMVVLTSALPPPPVGSTYRCWFEHAGQRTLVGTMWFSQSTGYWGGPLAAYGDTLPSGARFGVSLVPSAGGISSPAMLVAQL